jgi:hypothetical protein
LQIHLLSGDVKVIVMADIEAFLDIGSAALPYRASGIGGFGLHHNRYHDAGGVVLDCGTRHVVAAPNTEL